MVYFSRTMLGGLILVASSAATVFAQSSGNFAADVQTAQCVLASTNGALSGGSTKQLFSTTIKTPNSNKTTLLITPSLLTGLYTNTYINTLAPLANETAAVVVSVLFDGSPVAPETESHPSVVYDARFQQISTQLFQQLSECRDSSNPNCDFNVILSTLSAHSFNFIVPDPGVGTHTIDVSWALECDNGSGSPSPEKCSTSFTNNSAAACVGPGTVTVQQVKAFSQSGGITIQ
jgi:hypothetical protein